MKATIDIKTPAGQSLEGFPQTQITSGVSSHLSGALSCLTRLMDLDFKFNPKLHPGDTIIIKIEE